MPVSVFGPFNLDISAHVCLLVSVICFRYKTVIAKIVSHGHLSTAALCVLPYELVIVCISLPVITSILRIRIKGYASLKAYTVRRDFLSSIKNNFN
jgi:hypothetical protein